MNLFLSTKQNFIGKSADLISIAIVNENGNYFYGELTDFDRKKVSPYVRENVYPLLKYVKENALSTMTANYNLYNQGKLGVGIDYPLKHGSFYNNPPRQLYQNAYQNSLNMSGRTDATGQLSNDMVELGAEQRAVLPEDKHNFQRDMEFVGTRKQIVNPIINWLSQWYETPNEKMFFHGDNPSYDWVAFCDLFGGQHAIPENFCQHIFDIATIMKTKAIDPFSNREKFAFGKEMNVFEDYKGFVEEHFLYEHKIFRGNSLAEALTTRKVYDKLFEVNY